MHRTLYSATWAQNSQSTNRSNQHKWLGWKDYSALRASPLRGRPFGRYPSSANSSSRTIFQPTNCSHLIIVAGVEGFEPPYGGIKTRCLTAWRHPNLESTIGETSGAETQAVANLSSKGESFSPRTKKPSHPGGNSLKISRPRAQVSQAKKTQAPVPVRRAGPKPDSQSSARATSGYRRRTTLKQSFRPPDARKP